MTKFCPNCGKEVSSKFCPYCGFKMPEEQAPEPDNTARPEPEFDQPSQNYATYPENQTYSTYYIPDEPEKEPVTHRTWFIILFLIIFWPLGLFFMWRAKKFSKAVRVVITVIVSLLFVFNIATAGMTIHMMVNDDELRNELMNEFDDEFKDFDNFDDFDDDISGNTGGSDSGALIDGRTASEAAASYLSSLSFSRDGLIEQLVYEGYSQSDAVAAADSCGANWNEQAIGAAKDYLSTFPDMSRDDLIEQLEHEKFTHEQAVYGAEHAK